MSNKIASLKMVSLKNEKPWKYRENHENTLENHANQPTIVNNHIIEKHRQQWPDWSCFNFVPFSKLPKKCNWQTYTGPSLEFFSSKSLWWTKPRPHRKQTKILVAVTLDQLMLLAVLMMRSALGSVKRWKFLQLTNWTSTSNFGRWGQKE